MLPLLSPRQPQWHQAALPAAQEDLVVAALALGARVVAFLVEAAAAALAVAGAAALVAVKQAPRLARVRPSPSPATK